ncbi:MAG: hypothetical protein IIA54_00705 [Chloroflexi bacterium]|nr:hypothetical protein [Chloroflexota bacterium]
MEHGPHPGFLIAIGTWTAIQLVTIAVGAFLVMELLLGAATGMLHSLPAGSVRGWLPLLAALGWLGRGVIAPALWAQLSRTKLKKRLRKLGLDTQAVKGVIHGRTFGNEFWDQPEIAALLNPGHSGSGSAAPDAGGTAGGPVSTGADCDVCGAPLFCRLATSQETSHNGNSHADNSRASINTRCASGRRLGCRKVPPDASPATVGGASPFLLDPLGCIS